MQICYNRNSCSSPHEGSKFCVTHCQEEGHGHCTSWYDCDEIPHERSESEKCVEHCGEKGHGHCTWNNCGEISDEGRKEECMGHCEEKGHGHCTRFSCIKPPRMESIFCGFHCRP